MSGPASEPTTFAERDEWMRAALASDLPHVAARLAVRVALHLNVDTGRCDPSAPMLAAESHVSERSVYRLLDLLEHLGWLSITRVAGRANRYSLLTPDKPMAVVTPANPMSGVTSPTTATSMAGVDAEPLPNSAPTPAKSGTRPLPNRRGTPANRVAVKKKKTERENSKGKESDSQPAFDSLNFEEEDFRGKKESKPKARADLAERFEEFWRVYPGHVAKEAARKAFIKAVERGTDPQVIIAGAQRYRDERAGQDEKYTAHAVTWINAYRWEDEAPRINGNGPPIIDGTTGEIISPAPPAKRSKFEEFTAEMIARLCGGSNGH
jgi:hypothetical protein